MVFTDPSTTLYPLLSSTPVCSGYTHLPDFDSGRNSRLSKTFFPTWSTSEARIDHGEANQASNGWSVLDVLVSATQDLLSCPGVVCCKQAQSFCLLHVIFLLSRGTRHRDVDVIET